LPFDALTPIRHAADAACRALLFVAPPPIRF
jgi:hypothetical protein